MYGKGLGEKSVGLEQGLFLRVEHNSDEKFARVFEREDLKLKTKPLWQ